MFSSSLVIDASQRLSASRLLSSSSAVEVMCGIMNQYAQTRLDLSRDLLILLIMLTYYGDQVADLITVETVKNVSLK